LRIQAQCVASRFREKGFKRTSVRNHQHSVIAAKAVAQRRTEKLQNRKTAEQRTGEKRNSDNQKRTGDRIAWMIAAMAGGKKQ
jgi:hypothetical protein